ncbi:Kinesin light chain [Seminavis robusta]|uniref:Kinesin light chain n=1 Tax=Seminavis robusta TaxID=568900 RepID=A0A9N8ERJ6_9STRA|nr:Kinesin light chain [Seminavis robusta]|eukprot:Sro1486_g276630.1 Kinesin light chain (699) ;mRNA; r:10381-12563
MQAATKKRELPSSLPSEGRETKRCRLGNNVDTMLLLNDLGIQCHRLGKIYEAKALFRESLGFFSEGDDLLVRNNAPIDRNGAEAPSNIICPQESEYDEGMHGYRTPLRVKDNSSNEVAIATLRYNVGLTLIQTKDFDGARRSFTRALELMQNMPELQNSSNTLSRLKIQHNIGYCYYRTGHRVDAMHHYLHALLQVRVGNDSANKFDLAVACNCVAMLQLRENQCNSNDCLLLLRTSLANFVTASGQLSMETATVFFNIGQAHFYRTEYPQALVAFQEAARVRKEVFGGEESIDYAICIFGIGQTFHKLGSLDEAMKCFKRFLEIRESKGIMDRHDVITALNSIAILHRDKGELNEAYSVFEQALLVGVAAFGGSHTNLTSTLISFGSLCFQMGKYDTALKLYEQCLKTQKEKLGEQSPETINTLLSIAQIHWHVGRYRSAWITFKEILALQVQTIGPTSTSVASTVSSMALIYCQMEKYDDALELYQEALRIRRDCFTDQEHPDIIATLNTIGLVLCKLHEFKLAKESFQECLRSRMQALGPDHLDVSMLMHNLAAVHLDLGEEEEAVKLLERALQIRKKNLGPLHPEVASTLHHLGQAYQMRGALEEACEAFKQGLGIERQSETRDNVVIRKLLNLIGNIHLMRAQVPEMMECFVEASRIEEEGGQRAADFATTLLVTGHNFFDLSKFHPQCAPVA